CRQQPSSVSSPASSFVDFLFPAKYLSVFGRACVPFGQKVAIEQGVTRTPSEAETQKEVQGRGKFEVFEEQEMNSKNEKQSATDFAERVRLNQQKLSSNLKTQYDFIVCGSGSSGSVVAGRLAENADVSVLLIEAGGDDDVPTVKNAGQWV